MDNREKFFKEVDKLNTELTKLEGIPPLIEMVGVAMNSDSHLFTEREVECAFYTLSQTVKRISNKAEHHKNAAFRYALHI